jgi:hypothetical protein
MLVRGDVVSTTPAPPFDIETLSYYLRQFFSTWGTVAVWQPSNLATPYFVGADSSLKIGWNNVTLTTPLTISSVGTERFWMGIAQSYDVSQPGWECTSCRVAGVDNVGVAAPIVGYSSDIDASGDSDNISTRVPLGASRVPLIRAGITATAVTVPVELLELGIQ